MRLWVGLGIVCVLLTGLAWGQGPAAGESVAVAGDVAKPMALNRQALAQMPRASVERSEGGRRTVYEGVWLHEVLKAAGAPVGEALRGKALASYVLLSASDGYQALFALAETDPLFQDSRILLADSADGKALSGPSGNFRIVAPQDKRGARSIRMLSRIDVVQLRK